MTVRDHTPGERLDVRRGEAVVCIPLYGAHELFVGCLRSVLASTPEDVVVLVADDAGPDPASRRFVDELAASGHLRHDMRWMRQPSNLGFVGNVNAAFAAASPADVVLLNSDCEVAAGWLEGLREAAYSDSTVATATALTNHGTIVSVPYRNLPQPHLPKTLTFEEAAARVRAGSARLRPRLPTAIGHCVYVRREALDLTGGFDEAFAPAYGEEVDFSQRCLLHGLQHVAADEVLVLHHGSGSLNVDGGRNPLQDEHEELLRSRYPYYAAQVQAVEQDETGPLARSVAVARRAMITPRVTIDGRCLTPFVTGTQIHTLELIHALWRTRQVKLRIITPHDLGDYAASTFARMEGVELHPTEAVSDLTPKDDIVHRPYQVSSDEDLLLLSRCGRRAVVTHQDLIAYRNPGYFPGRHEYGVHRRLTRRALMLADLVLFFSRHAARDALADDLVEEERARVIPIGVDHRLGSLRPAPAPPRGNEDLAGTPYLLCLGTDFRHKNRLFALRLFATLRERHGWDGRLVFAGPRVAHGSSAGGEAEWLALHPEVADHVVHLPAVDEAEKGWLYDHTALVVYPTTYEGFGLVPFEAADAGAPCLWAPQASLPEVLPESAALIVPWDAEATADRAIEVLRDATRRDALLDAVRTAGAELTWDRTGAALLEAYDHVLRVPARQAARLAVDAIEIEAERADWEGRYWHLFNEIGPTGIALVGPEAWLPEDAQRALAGLARRRSTRGPLLAALRAVHRAGGGGRGAPRQRLDQGLDGAAGGEAGRGSETDGPQARS